MNTTLLEPMNISQAFDINANSLFSTNCLEDSNKLIAMCRDFHLQVLATYETRFIVALISLFVLFFFQLYVKNRQPKFSQTEAWIKHIDYRIDYVMIILIGFILAYLFLM